VTDIVLQLTDAGLAALQSAGGSANTVIAELGFTATPFDPAPTLTALPGEFKRVGTAAGVAPAPNVAHLTAYDTSADIWEASGLGLYLDDGTLFAAYSASEIVLTKASSAFALIAVDVVFNADIAGSITFGNPIFANPPATTETAGAVELATEAEALLGEDDARALTPARGKEAVTTWLLREDLMLGATDVMTPNLGSTGGMRIRGNAVSGHAYLQFTSHDLASEWGFAVVTATGKFDWHGAGGLCASGSTAWIGNEFTGPIGVGGDLAVRGGADILLESQFPGYPVSLIYNDRGTLAFNSNGWERGLFDEGGALHLKGARQFANQSTIAGNGNLRVWAGLPGGVAYTALDTNDYTPFQILRQINGSITTVGAITSTDFVTTYSTSCDYRLKEDLREAKGALDIIMRAKVWDYRWIGTDRRSTNFIAHELAEIVPDAVTGRKDATRELEIQIDPGRRPVLDEDGTVLDAGADPITRVETVMDIQTVDAGKMVPFLTAAFQELTRIVQSQSEQLAAPNLARLSHIESALEADRRFGFPRTPWAFCDCFCGPSAFSRLSLG